MVAECKAEACAMATQSTATGPASSFDVEPAGSGSAGSRRSSRRSSISLSRRESALVAVLGQSMCGEENTRSMLQDLDVTGGLSQTDATSNFVIACVGSGVVVFPRVMADSGVVGGLALLVVAASCCCFSGTMLISCCRMAETVKGLRHGSIASYEGVAEVALGPSGKAFLTVSKNLYFLGTLAVYIIFESDALAALFNTATDNMRFLVVGPIFLCLAMLKDLQQVKQLMPIGILAAFVQCFCMAGGGIYEAFKPDKATVKVDWGLDGGILDWGASLATFLFGFGSIATMPCLRSQMQNAEELPGSLVTGMTIVTAIYGAIMVIGYLSFGEAVEDNMLNNFNASSCVGFQCLLGKLAGLSIIANLFISAPTFILCIVTAFEASGDSDVHTPMTVPNLLFRAALIVWLVVLSRILPYAKQIIGVQSALFATCNSIFIPLLCFLALSRRLACEPPLKQAWPHMLAALTGCICMLVGTSGAVGKLMEKIGESQEAQHSGDPAALASAFLSALSELPQAGMRLFV
eukprot:TRINITY_DN102617_c0_g1_i1.p1 TRINITY_DN102617_c0_g1~~TRINITY_DN102617_c0_g1_i1.p1  ORF type:complete len:521 (-),score=82.61 TRINITY_DN102617_c0_g1_i1:307-1869(-)